MREPGPGIHRRSPRFVYLLNATNNICFYFCAGPSPALYFFKSRAPMTNGWMDHRAEARGREKRAGYSGQIIVKGRERAPSLPASYFVPHERRFIMVVVQIFLARFLKRRRARSLAKRSSTAPEPLGSATMRRVHGYEHPSGFDTMCYVPCNT